MIYFKDKNLPPLETNLYQLGLIDKIMVNGESSYLILKGRGWEDCDANYSLYVHRPSDGPMKGEATQTRYNYPGKEFSFENDKLLLDQRAFYGQCFENAQPSIIWYGYSVKKGRKHKDVQILDLSASPLRVKTFRGQTPQLSSILQMVKNGGCKEIPGIDRTSEP